MSAILKNQLLLLYKTEVEGIRRYAKNCNLTEEQINNILKDSIERLKIKETVPKRSNSILLKLSVIFLKAALIFTVLLTILYVVLNVNQTTSSIVLRNVQGFIYPGLKLLRFLSVPFVKKFPWLTSLYDESCLVQNPLFYVNEMECWPCENVHSILDLTGLQNKSIVESGIPYLITTNQRIVDFSTMQNTYEENRKIFDENAWRITSSNSSLTNISHFFDITSYKNEKEIHVKWRINRMLPARFLRKLFQRPFVINKWSGQSSERFVFFDGPQSPKYVLPNPECSYVFLIQGSGKRTIILKPTRECSKSCKILSIILNQSNVLWYNWWYWRPLSLPVKNSTEMSITYMNSYC